MKVVFANPPHIRSDRSCPENNFAIDGFIFRPELRRWRFTRYFFLFLHHVFGLGRGVRYGVRAGSRWPFTQGFPMDYAPYPFFMGYAASYLKKHGVDVEVLDAIAEEEYSYQKFLHRIRDANADIVILECSAPTIDIDLWFAQQIAPFAEIALAGPHLTIDTTENIRRDNPFILYFLQGEYILSVLDMVRSRRSGVFEPQVVRNLDDIPFPFRDYTAATRYYDPSMPTPRPQLQIYGSKGCPFKCTFCLWPQTMYGGHVSLREPRFIAEEIRTAVAEHGYRSIFFDDDTFNQGTNRISELCDHLRKIGLPWTMMGRLDCSPEWLYDKMVASGCVGMRFGIESFDLGVLKNIRKGLERVDFRKTLGYLAIKYPELMLHLTMMRDLPGQSEKIHHTDMSILHDLGFSTRNIFRSFQLSRCSPFPGTAMYKELIAKHGKEVLTDFRRYDGSRKTVVSDLGSKE